MGRNIYTSTTGYFFHDDPEHTPLPAVPPRFGLKDDSDERWSKFLDKISQLNKNSPVGTSYKFFLLSRHGQGYHNIAELKYGTIAWDDYWAKLNGDDELVWGPDPLLTRLGVEQARRVHDVWITESKVGLTPPHKRYCSPLTRAMHTCYITFDEVFNHYDSPVLVMENCREQNGVHTCDKRNTRSYIVKTRPDFEIESSLTESDELWSPSIRETKVEVAARATKMLDHIFEHDAPHTFISITAHGGFINGFLGAIGREHIILPTGGVFPVIVRAEFSS